MPVTDDHEEHRQSSRGKDARGRAVSGRGGLQPPGQLLVKPSRVLSRAPNPPLQRVSKVSDEQKSEPGMQLLQPPRDQDARRINVLYTRPLPFSFGFSFTFLCFTRVHWLWPGLLRSTWLTRVTAAPCGGTDIGSFIA